MNDDNYYEFKLNFSTLYELRYATRNISYSISDENIPLTVDGKEIESISLTKDMRVEIKTKNN